MNAAQDIAIERKLIFTNLLNGCNTQAVAAAFQKSEKEITDTFKFVVQKIKSYLFERDLLIFPCDTVDDARKNRLSFLETVEKVNLATQPKFKIITQSAENFI